MSDTVLVTGASRGIGRETARRFAHAGSNVAINFHRSRQEAEGLALELRQAGCSVMTVCADVSQRRDVEEMVRAVTERFGGIDVLVNNAGIARQALFTDTTETEWQQIFDINVKGVFNCCQCVLPGMIGKKRGRIINVSSIWGLTGASCEAPYSASKAAVIGLTKALAKELGPCGIQVNCVAPGVIGTDMNAGLDEETLECLKDQTPLGRIGSPSDVAAAILFLASEQAGFITGQVLSPNGGFVI